MIQVTNLTKVFRGETDVTALTGINLNVDDGDIYGIIGMSGAGKSTLLRCIALLETPTQGRIEVDGVDISTLQGKDLTALRKSVGVIFQGYNLLMQRNVLRNVCFPLELDGVKKEAREARALELLNVVGLADKARAYPAQLSGGQKQRGQRHLQQGRHHQPGRLCRAGDGRIRHGAPELPDHADAAGHEGGMKR